MPTGAFATARLKDAFIGFVTLLPPRVIILPPLLFASRAVMRVAIFGGPARRTPGMCLGGGSAPDGAGGKYVACGVCGADGACGTFETIGAIIKEELDS